MRILVVGRNGQVAAALSQLAGMHAHDMRFLGRNDVDVFSKLALDVAVSQFKPETIVNAAAYTAVDRAETDVDAAYALNEHVPRLLAEVSSTHRVPFIHISTDYVFNGAKPAPYQPADQTGPINVYGASKAAGEIAVRSANPLAVILRTAWVYSAAGTNFVHRMLALGAERDELRIVDDQIGNPTLADDVADACLRIAAHDGFRAGSRAGVYHFAGSGDVTWHGFARAIFTEARRHGWSTPKRVVAINTDAYPTPARRPANSRLDCTSTEATFGILRNPWQAGLRLSMDRLRALQPGRPHDP